MSTEQNVASELSTGLSQLNLSVKQGVTSEQCAMLSKYKEEMPNTRTAEIVDLIMTSPLIYEDSYLPCKLHFVGSTDYLDGVRPEDLTRPIMWGIDQFKRPYVAIRTTMENVFSINNKLDKDLGVETFFQRYTGNGKTWTSGDHYNHPGNSIINSSMGDEEYHKFKDLLNMGKTIISKPSFDQKTTRYYKLICE